METTDLTDTPDSTVTGCCNNLIYNSTYTSTFPAVYELDGFTLVVLLPIMGTLVLGFAGLVIFSKIYVWRRKTLFEQELDGTCCSVGSVGSFSQQSDCTSTEQEAYDVINTADMLPTPRTKLSPPKQVDPVSKCATKTEQKTTPLDDIIDQRVSRALTRAIASFRSTGDLFDTLSNNTHISSTLPSRNRSVDFLESIPKEGTEAWHSRPRSCGFRKNNLQKDVLPVTDAANTRHGQLSPAGLPSLNIPVACQSFAPPRPRRNSVDTTVDRRSRPTSPSLTPPPYPTAANKVEEHFYENAAFHMQVIAITGQQVTSPQAPSVGRWRHAIQGTTEEQPLYDTPAS